ncbi:MAG: phosphatidylinositol-specific phospholipase C/glycerophosphodiester phosphodiesterase family protein [Planctomycetes bacterium]|nr:phosphatidylinositol-specific phospholipase C/glycerophosphodiester phosphodiesterase family protein [Planctomycetota bacterium]
MVRTACIVMLLWAAPSGPAQPGAAPLLHAHAHNDYLHDPPLLQALAHGFTSVEADIFLVGGKLCVAHESKNVTPERTLQSLYLEPLRQRVKENGGHVYREVSRFLLLIDIKTSAEPTYRRLHEVLAGYQDMLTTFDTQGRKDKAVLVIVSGNRPLALMQSQPVRYAGYDGRLPDLDSELSSDVIPMISDQWIKPFAWKGEGPMPQEERQRLNDIVRRAHAKGRLVRFWLTPDNPSKEREAVWRQLLAAGVDLINTDDLKGLQEFLLQHGR